MRFLNELGIDVSVLELRELEVRPPLADFDPHALAAEAAAKAGRIGDPGPARALYRRFGIDPTRHRPSSEALLRRVRRGDRLPRVNSLVDLASVMSLRLQVPVGLYDLAAVEGGDLTLRVGRDDEAYPGIRKALVKVGGRICVADALGAVGNPTSDSARTMITTATENAAWIYFLAVDDEAISDTAELVARFGRGLVRVL